MAAAHAHDAPGTVPPPAVRQHPRRPPAHKSVSLRHSPPTSPNPASDKANPPSISPKLPAHKQSSGESSDAGRWFETTNNNVQQSATTLSDNEPPFFLRQSSSSATPPEGYVAHYDAARNAIPYRPYLARNNGTEGSSTGDFRSVIDDLTIANKKLKQKLRKYEKVHDAHLEQDKLFEVRFLGLPDHKKKELEDTLRKFAAGLDEPAATDYPPIAASHMPGLKLQNTASSMSRFAESGYASMSASGQNSSAPSNQASNQPDDSRKMTRSAYNRQQQTIHSFLHDIPAGLLPNSNASMSDRTKKKLVVRRLEQIFAGKHSVPGNHPQPMQQEEVAQSAASADRQEREATGRHFRPEGLRVARIVANRDGGAILSGQAETLQKLRPGLQIGEQDFAGAASPDQRPTRPLDLDPSRAQVPGENMEYIRHLGFTPPDMRTGDAPEEGHGWLYLNLLINMAQLHTLNVTPEFVKDALTDYSSHLELSHDGRKIRWSGGLDVTRHSSDSSSDLESGNSPYDQISPLNGTKAEHGNHKSYFDPIQKARNLARAEREKELDKFAYTPMFFKKEESEEDEGYGFEGESSGASLQPPQQAGKSSGFGSSAVHSGSTTRKPHRDGPMIFYTKAKFCTDLSGDRLGSTLLPSGAYDPVTSHPIGSTSYPRALSQQGSVFAPKGRMDTVPMDIDPSTPSLVSSGDEDFDFLTESLKSDAGNNSPSEIIQFEASGLGGVQPEDNFAIRVRRSQTQTTASGPVRRRQARPYPKKIFEALAQQSSPETEARLLASPPRVIREELLSASCKSLPISTLPPASFLPFDSTSSGNVSDDDTDSDVSSEAESESDDEQGTTLQHLNMSSIQDEEYNESDAGSDEESEYSVDTESGSIDLLATARELDPNAVRLSEREYDAAVAERLATEIVAGSSAATAGGGSGFNTPADGLLGSKREDASPRDKGLSSSSGNSSSRAYLKRARTSEPMTQNSKSRKTG